MTGLIEDCRHAVRVFAGTPGSSLLVVLIVAVAAAFVGAFVSLYVDLALRPHPGFERSGRLATIVPAEGSATFALSLELIEQINEDMTSLEAIAGVASRGRFAVGPEAEPVNVEQVTRGFFAGLRPRLVLGRGFSPGEHDADAEPVAVISHRYWQEAFGGDEGVLGRMVEIAGSGGPFSGDELGARRALFRIIGVMAPELPSVRSLRAAQTDFWLPYERTVPIFEGERVDPGRGPASIFKGLARRAPGVSSAALTRELNARGYGDRLLEFGMQPSWRLEAADGVVDSVNIARESRRQLRLFLFGSMLLALVAASNVSLFLLARAPGRRRELGTRMAVGAPLKRLGRQLATEAGLLVAISAVLGLLVSIWLNGYLRGLAFFRGAGWQNVTLLDWRVLGIVGVFLAVLMLLVALAPLLDLKRVGIAASSRDVAARATTAQRAAGTVQVALACTLAGAALAFAWYVGSMMFGDPGFRTRNLHAIEVQPLGRSGAETARVREGISSIPGVTDVAFGTDVPASSPLLFTSPLPHPTDPSETIEVMQVFAEARYVDVLGLELLRGRSFTSGDADVALVNQAFAERIWGRDDVVGEVLPFTIRNGRIAADSGGSTTIVGVLEDVSFGHPADGVPPTAFFPFANGFLGNGTALVESAYGAAELEQSLQRLIDAGALEIQRFNARALDDLRANRIAPDRARGLLTFTGAALVVLLTAFGFYGTQRYLVAAGRREYAIRAALGGGPRSLGRLVLARGLFLGVPGLAVGAMLAFIVVAWLRDDYVSRDISPAAVSAAAVLVLAAVLVAASYGPAGRARRVRPGPVLREG